ncbi:hypothetical protein D3C80_913320 [compost metagenome]
MKHASIEGHAARHIAEIGVIGDAQRAAIDPRAASIGIGPVEDQGSHVGLHQPARALQDRVDARRDARAARRSVADADHAVSADQGDGVAGQDVAVGDELHAGDVDGPLALIDRDGARRSREDSEGRVLEGRVDRAELRPVVLTVVRHRAEGLPHAVAAADHAVVLSGRAVPETQRQSGGIDQVHLVRHRSLDIEVRRRKVGCQAVVRQRALIVEDTIDAGIQGPAPAGVDVERAVERQIAFDIDQVVQRPAGHIGLTEAEVERRTVREREVAGDAQRAGRSSGTARIDRAAVGDDDIAADDADAAQRGAGVDAGQSSRARLVAVDEQAASVDRRRAGVAVHAGQHRHAGTIVNDAAQARDG